MKVLSAHLGNIKGLFGCLSACLFVSVCAPVKANALPAHDPVANAILLQCAQSARTVPAPRGCNCPVFGNSVDCMDLGSTLIKAVTSDAFETRSGYFQDRTLRILPVLPQSVVTPIKLLATNLLTDATGQMWRVFQEDGYSWKGSDMNSVESLCWICWLVRLMLFGINVWDHSYSLTSTKGQLLC